MPVLPRKNEPQVLQKRLTGTVMAFDFKKEYKEFYMPKNKPGIVTVPSMDKRLHHEIYLSDARKVAPEKLKTVIRHPIRKR